MNARVKISFTPEQIQEIIVKHLEESGKQIASGVTFVAKIKYEDRGNDHWAELEKAEIDIIIEI